MQPRRPLRKSSSYAFFDEIYPGFKHKRTHLTSYRAGDLAEHVLLSPEEAEVLAEKLGPRVRVLTNKHAKKNEVAEILFPGSSKTHTILTFGCSGIAGPAQNAVAALSNKVIANPRYNVLTLLHAGDIFYPSGAPSAKDPIFQNLFYIPYANPELQYLHSLPVRAVLGNHEFNDRKVRYLKQKWLPPFRQPSGKTRGRHLIRHAHMPQDEDPIVPVRKQTLLSSKELDVRDAPKFGMEYYCGSDIDGKVQYIYLNSSTLLNEYLEYIKHVQGITILSPAELRTNQFAFLLKTYSDCIAAGRTPVLVMHHPLINMGVRNIAYDSKFHLKPLEIAILDRIFQIPRGSSPDLINRILISSLEDINTIPGVPLPTVDADNLCLLLARLFASHNMNFRAILCAHEHMMSVIRTDGIPNVSQNYHPNDKTKTPIVPPYQRPDDLSKYPVFQVISGGGGGTLQEPYSWNLGENIGCCIKTNGVCAMTYDPLDPKELIIDLYTVDAKRYQKDKTIEGLHLQFSDKSPRPIFAKAPEMQEYQEAAILREVINKTCFNFQKLLDKKVKETKGIYLNPKLKEYFKMVVHKISSFFTQAEDEEVYTDRMNDVLIMNEMQTYVNSYKPIPFTEAIKKLYELSLKLKNADPTDSFLHTLNEQLFAKYDKNLEELYRSTQNRMRLRV